MCGTQGIPWQSSSQDSMLSLPRAWIQSLVEELRSHKLPCMTKKKRKLKFSDTVEFQTRTKHHIYKSQLQDPAQPSISSSVLYYKGLPVHVYGQPTIITSSTHPSPLKQHSLATPWAQEISHRWLARISELWPMCGANPAHSLCMAYKLRIAFAFFFKEL